MPRRGADAIAVSAFIPCARRSANVSAREELHDEQPQLAILPVVVHGHDVGMAQLREDARFRRNRALCSGSVTGPASCLIATRRPS